MKNRFLSKPVFWWIIPHSTRSLVPWYALKTAVTEYAKTKGEYDTRLTDITDTYKNIENADPEAELIADLVGDYLFTDEAFVRQLSTQNRNLFQKIFDEIKYLCKIVTSGSKEARELEKVKKVFSDVYRESGRTQKNTTDDGGVRYSLSEDKNLYKYVKDALSGKLSEKSYYKLSNEIPDRMAKDIENIVGFSVKGYGNEISPGSIRHIEKEHGLNGRADQSMKDHHDLARVSYVIENYEKIREGKRSTEYRNSDGTFAKTIVLQKKIDNEFYYVVEAVPDAKIKSLHITSAYINKKDTFSDVLMSNDPKRYVQDEHQPNVSTDSIPNSDKNVNTEKSNYNSNDNSNDIAPVQNSLSDDGKQATKKYGDYAVLGEDIRLEAEDDIAPLPKNAESDTEYPDDYAPIGEGVVEDDAETKESDAEIDNIIKTLKDGLAQKRQNIVIFRFQRSDIFCFAKCDIETYGFSDIIFAS